MNRALSQSASRIPWTMAGGTVVVTGASGYIGSHVVANLLSRGRKVRATVRDLEDPIRVEHLKGLPVSQGGSCLLYTSDAADE